jgi:hypothetical protein
MAAFVRRWRAPLLTGIGIWILSFPLLTAHPAPAAKRVHAIENSSRTDQEERRITHQAAAVAPAPLILGERYTPPAPEPQPQTVAQPAAAWSPPAVKANWIYIPRLGLNQPVGWYGDCKGAAPVPRWGAWRWSCAGANNTYIMAHNPGVFTPILGLRAGDEVDYGDPGGRVHTYHVTFTTIVSNTQMWPLNGTPSSSLTLQTCWTWDGSRDFIVRATEG